MWYQDCVVPGLCLIDIILVYRNSSMCAASLKNGGPSLITHCLCQWLIKKEYSYGFIGDISKTQLKSKRLL